MKLISMNKFTMDLLLLLLTFGKLTVAEIFTAGNIYQRVDDALDAGVFDDDVVNIQSHLKCSQDQSCLYLANSKKHPNVFQKLSTHPDLTSQVVWHKKAPKGYMDCRQALENGIKNDQVIRIILRNGSHSNAFCDMGTDGGGWTVIQRRKSKLPSFQKRWNEYKNGFGNLYSSFWLGLDAIHQLTSGYEVELRIDLQDFNGRTGYVKYNDFGINDETDSYRLHLKYNEGDIGDSLGPNSGTKFSTIDRDNGNNPLLNWVSLTLGPWWHNMQYISNLNNLQSDGEESNEPGYIRWNTWSGSKGLISFTEMKLRRKM